VIKSADWLIDMGPEGGDMGGKVIATGTPEQVARNQHSHTGRFYHGAQRQWSGKTRWEWRIQVSRPSGYNAKWSRRSWHRTMKHLRPRQASCRKPRLFS